MTPEQKRDYNRRRTEAFRKRRREEEQLLSTPAGRISSEALAKAQQIMVRNARKAESARLRYQKMSAEERKTYNMKRASAKKFKKTGEHMPQYLEQLSEQQSLQNILDDVAHLEDVEEDHEDDLAAPEEDQEILETEEVFLSPEDHINHVINEVSHPNPKLEIFAQMEKDVERRTQIAKATIHNQYVDNLSSLVDALGSSNAIVGGIQYDVAPIQNPLPPIQNLPLQIQNPQFPICQKFMPNPGEVLEEEPTEEGAKQTHVIDEKMLHEMVRTGVDANGLPVEVRTVEGKRIRSVEDLM